MSERSWKETLQVEAQDLVDQVKRLIEAGNVRRIILKQGDHVLFEIPLSAGVAVGFVAVAAAPVLAAVAAVAALVTHCTIEVERVEDGAGADEPPLHARAEHPDDPSPHGGSEPGATQM